MKDITLKITGRQLIGTKEEDQIEFVTDGKAYLKNDAIYIVYNETEVSGFLGCKTTIKVKDGSLSMKRFGESGFGTQLYFKEEERYHSSYDTPYGKMEVEILTKKVNCELSKETLLGKVDIEYVISLDGMGEGKNKLSIDIM